MKMQSRAHWATVISMSVGGLLGLGAVASPAFADSQSLIAWWATGTALSLGAL